MNFETNRNLISSVEHGFTDSIISKYSYTNDLLGRRTGKVQHFDNKVKNFDFGYNPRSEVISAIEQNDANFNYGFIYDNIGNRINSTESGISKSYETNNLNQYTANSVDTGFTPTYDADGNQTRIKTSAGIFTVEYNAENRPVQFKGSMGRIYNMSYDYMGRRFYMSSYFQGMHDGDSTELFYYNGYTLIESQQILSGPNAMRFTQSYIWDPTAAQSTRPLAMFDNVQNIHYYTHDANKNITELISDSGAISAHYEYSPFGAITASSGDLSYSNPFQFSSEFFDSELGLIYYNYRHYNPLDGRWISRDPIEEAGGFNLYGIVNNNIINFIDILGNANWVFVGYEPELKPTRIQIGTFDVNGPFQGGYGLVESFVKTSVTGINTPSVVIEATITIEKRIYQSPSTSSKILNTEIYATGISTYNMTIDTCGQITTAGPFLTESGKKGVITNIKIGTDKYESKYKGYTMVFSYTYAGKTEEINNIIHLASLGIECKKEND